jgi:hypothetical protein
MLQQPTCAHCGAPLPLSRATDRRRRFCSSACRVAEFRYSHAVAPYDHINCNETHPKNTAISDSCRGEIRGRGIDLRTIDRGLAERIIAAELPKLRWRP